jgi:hypothetical protein
MKCIDIDIVQPRNKAIQAGTFDKTKEPFSIRSKRFFSIDKSEWVRVLFCTSWLSIILSTSKDHLLLTGVKIFFTDS